MKVLSVILLLNVEVSMKDSCFSSITLRRRNCVSVNDGRKLRLCVIASVMKESRVSQLLKRALLLQQELTKILQVH